MNNHAILNSLLPFANIPIDYAVISDLFANYRSPKDKIATLEKIGMLIRIKKGVYVISPQITKSKLSVELIANHLYGPSYVSLHSALSYYGLIPERVHIITSVTTKRAKRFTNSLGTFDYETISTDYYSVGIRQQTTEAGHFFLIASPEKAVCDLIQASSGLRLQSSKAMLSYLEDDMRIDLAMLQNWDKDIIRQCIETGKKKTTLSFLLKILGK
jgi:hypothetical protein